jgi:hypothetical protein
MPVVLTGPEDRGEGEKVASLPNREEWQSGGARREERGGGGSPASAEKGPASAEGRGGEETAVVCNCGW